MRGLLTLLLLSCAALVLQVEPAAAHGMRSGYLEIDEVAGAEPLVRLRVSAADLHARPVIEGCRLHPLTVTDLGIDGAAQSYRASCAGPLAGATISVQGLGVELEEAVVRIVAADGAVHSGVVTAASPRLQVPPAARGDAAVASDYLALGLRHILSGLDHLLFLLLLVVQLQRLRPILLAETAFSLSHGLAFTATATGWLQVAPAPIEACIALSLVLLALDVGRPRAAGARATAALALVFGAVHGLGFAGGLRELGVPAGQLAPAVLGFGLGVELGQLGVVLTAWAALRALRRHRLAPRVFDVVVLVAGALAMSWLLQRGYQALEGI